MTSAAPKICLNALLLPSHLGGIGTYCHRLLKSLLELHPECEYTLLLPAKAAQHFRDLGDRPILRVIAIESTALRQLWLQFIFPFLGRRFDLVHSIGNIGLAFGPRSQIITIHDTYEKVSPERFSLPKRLLMGWLISLSGRRAARIITDSANTAKDISRFYPHMAAKTSVVYLGNKFPVPDSIGERDRKHFLFVGTLEPGKNLATVLRAFALFHKNHGQKLRIVGALGWNHGSLPDLVDALGIRKDVEFLGYIPDAALKAIYADSLGLILASSYEGFGLPAIEAMACGCPTLLARNSSLPEAGGDASLFFGTFDHAELARRMEELYRDRALVERTVRVGLIHARRFSWEKTAEETFAVYRKSGLEA